MFLTKIDLAPERRLARKYLGSPQAMHAVVMSATGGHDGNGPGRVLWRVDRGVTTALYILSPLEPDCSQLVAEAGTAGTQARTLDYSPFLASLDAGQLWAFRLAANPSYSASRGQGARGQRYGHVTVEQHDSGSWTASHGSASSSCPWTTLMVRGPIRPSWSRTGSVLFSTGGDQGVKDTTA